MSDPAVGPAAPVGDDLGSVNPARPDRGVLSGFSERSRTLRSEPPRPETAGSLDDIAAALVALRSWAGDPSFTDITRRVAGLREPSQRPGRVTVYDCFRSGRRRMAPDLLRDVVLALGIPEEELTHWLSAHRRVTGAGPVPIPVRVMLGLPSSADAFIGRGDDLATLVAGPVGAVTVISGMAGSGKTELALAAAHRISRLRPQPVRTLFADLRGDSGAPVDVATALESLLRLLGVPSQELAGLGTEGLAARFRECLARKSGVLVLDNVSDVDVVRHLLPQARHMRVLITSRRALAGLDHLRLEALPVAEALTLLASAVGRDAVDREPAAAQTIVELCGALPLDLRLAAAAVASRPGWTLDDHARRLTTLGPGASVRPALASSYAQLAAGDQTLFRALTLHPGRHVSVHAASALVNGDLAGVVGSLARLDDERLVRLVDGRVTLHDLVAAFAAEQRDLEDPFSGQQAARERLYEHYVDAARLAMRTLSLGEETTQAVTTPIAQRAEWLPDLSDMQATLGWVKAELPNLLALAGSAADHPVTVSDLSEVLATYLVTNGLYRDATTLHTQAITHGVPSRRGDAHRRLGRVAEQVGNYAEALRHLGRAAELTGDDDPKMHNALGNIAKRLGQYDEAAGFFGRAADLAGEQGLGLTRGRAIGNLADTLRIQGRHERSAELFAEALVLADAAGDSLNVTILHSNSALLSAQRCDYAAALSLARAAIGIAEEFGHTALLPRTTLAAGAAAMALGELESAAEFIAAAHHSARELGQREVVCEAETLRGRLLVRTGEHDLAREVFTAEVETALRLGSPQLKIEALNELASVELALDDDANAEAHFTEALTLATETGDLIEVAVAERGLGAVHAVRADPAQAADHWLRARDAFAGLGRAADAAAVQEHLQDLAG